MSGRMGLVSLFLCSLLALSVAGCGDSTSPDVDALARSWVDRQLDSLSDTTVSGIPDSAMIDSLAKVWTSDDWLRFWEGVEREQMRRRRVVDTTHHGS